MYSTSKTLQVWGGAIFLDFTTLSVSKPVQQKIQVTHLQLGQHLEFVTSHKVFATTSVSGHSETSKMQIRAEMQWSAKS